MLSGRIGRCIGGVDACHLYLLQVLGAAGCTGETKMHVVRSAKILTREIASDCPALFPVNPVGQCLRSGIPRNRHIVPLRVFEV